MSFVPLWLLFLFLLYKSDKRIIITKLSLYLIFIYFIAVIQGHFFYAQGYYLSKGPGVARTLIYCSFFYILGTNIKNIRIQYILLALIFSVLSLATFNSSAFFKNQYGLLIGECLTLLLYCILPTIKNKKESLFMLLLCLYFFILLYKSHSRTPMVATIISYFYVTIREKNIKNIQFIIIIIIIFIICSPLYINSNSFLFYIQGDMSNGLETITLDSITSKRLQFFAIAYEEFINHPFIGVGGWAYIDSFPLYVLRSGGLLSFFLYIPITYLYFIQISNKCINLLMCQDNNDRLIIKSVNILVIYFSILSIFEGYVPFGPGVSTFFLWLMLGIFERYKMLFYNKKEINNNY